MLKMIAELIFKKTYPMLFDEDKKCCHVSDDFLILFSRRGGIVEGVNVI
jgi:hypothetical protein